LRLFWVRELFKAFKNKLRNYYFAQEFAVFEKGFAVFSANQERLKTVFCLLIFI